MTAPSMRPPFRRRLSALMAIALVAPIAAPTQVGAQDAGMKTIAVAAVADYDELLADIDFLGQLGDRPAMAQTIEGIIGFFTGGRGLEGLDKSRPIGVVLQTDGASFAPIGCLPVADLTPVLELAENFGFEPIDSGDGVYELELPEQTIYFQNAGAWTFVAQTPGALANAPADPSAMLTKLVDTYDLGVTLMAQNVPDMYRQIAIEQLRQGMQEGLEQEENETDDEFEFRKNLAESQIDQISDLIQGLDIATIGWCIDSEAKQTFIEAVVTGIEGSDIELAVSAYDNNTSGVAAFHRPEEAASVLACGTTPPELLEKQKEQTEVAIRMIRAQVEKAIQEQIDNGEFGGKPEAEEGARIGSKLFVDIYEQVMRSGRIDLGASVSLSEGGFDMIAGAYLPDPSQLEDAFKQLAEVAEKDEQFPGVEWGFANHAGVTLHGMSIPVPDNGQARDFLGETLRVVLGISSDRAYLAAGSDCEAKLKAAIDASASVADKQVSPMELTLSIGQVLSAAEGVAPPQGRPMIGMILDGIDDAPAGSDRLVVTSDKTERGVRIRYLLEEGVLRAIGKGAAAAAAMQQQGQMQPGGF